MNGKDQRGNTSMYALQIPVIQLVQVIWFARCQIEEYLEFTTMERTGEYVLMFAPATFETLHRRWRLPKLTSGYQCLEAETRYHTDAHMLAQ